MTPELPESKPLPPEVDPRLEFRWRGESGRCYLIGNSHTFRGRMAAWNDEGHEFSVSKNEIEWLTPEAEIWLDGFLAGSEPKPPAHGTEEDEEKWDVRRRRYRRTGDWHPATRDRHPDS